MVRRRRRFAGGCVLMVGLMTVLPVWAGEPTVVRLWPQRAPGAQGDQPNDVPTLTVFLPERRPSPGAAVVICPGGGYGHLATDHEGRQFAEWFNRLGVAGFMLEYRHRNRGYGHPAPLQDAQRAIRTVRARAAEWNVDPQRVGIIGFSAGGHLASTAGTHFDDGDPKSADPIERLGCRPDFMILCYPVITLDGPYAHRGSRKNLLGDRPDPALVQSLCNDSQVTSRTPPTFLFHTDADRSVPAENSVSFYLALRRAGVPAEMHIYQTGRHGLGLACDIPGTSSWPDRLKDWMRTRKLIDVAR
ncbi:MAG: alpha/beta hydrolase [Thermoguttaceae bacterium]